LFVCLLACLFVRSFVCSLVSLFVSAKFACLLRGGRCAGY
jgi:hypothetical protein